MATNSIGREATNRERPLFILPLLVSNSIAIQGAAAIVKEMLYTISFIYKHDCIGQTSYT